MKSTKAILSGSSLGSVTPVTRPTPTSTPPSLTLPSVTCDDSQRALPVSERRPADNLALLGAYLARSGICSLELATDPIDYGRCYIGRLGSYRYYLDADAPLDALEEVCAVAERAAPALAHADILKELAKLSMLTRRKSEGDDDVRLRLAAYADKLSAYPADAVLTALREWPDQSEWFPTWNELKERLGAHAGPRLFLRDRLRAALATRKKEMNP